MPTNEGNAWDVKVNAVIDMCKSGILLQTSLLRSSSQPVQWINVSKMAGDVGEDTPARPEGKAGTTDTPNNAGRTSNRKRKQADFYNPGDVKTTEKLVVKEVCTLPET